MNGKNEDAPLCDCEAINEEIVKKTAAAMPPDKRITDTAEFFAVFGDRTRIKILWALIENEMCVCDIAALLKMSKSSISHQLKILKQSRLLKFRREGKMIFYSPCDTHIRSIIEQGFEHIGELYEQH